jgi:Ca-activated chloride channel homolog
MRRLWLVLAVSLAWTMARPAAKQVADPGHAGPADAGAVSIRITSPLGRTGVIGTVRIVAQIHIPTGMTISPVQFYVDRKLVGTVADGPPYAVQWTDENPFERREILVDATDSAGHVVSDHVELPAFELTDVSDVTAVLLDTGVYDAKDRPIGSLPNTAFTVRENGVEQKIDQVVRETLPSTFVLLVDNSQSMSRRMDFVRLAAQRLAATLRQHDRVIVAPFNAHLGAVTGPTDDDRTITEAISAMHAGGGTALFDGLLESTTLLHGATGRRVVVLITDGYDENSSATLDAVLKKAQDNDVSIYTIAVGGVAGISLKGQDIFRRLATSTGGRVFLPYRDEDLASIAGLVSADAHMHYLITYTPSDQKRDGTWRAITVSVPDGYHVRTRSGYFAQKPNPIRPVLEFTVTSAEDHYVDVSSDELEVVEDGVPQTIDTFQEAVDPVSIVLALDASGSMKKAADQVRQTAREFVQAVRPEDNLSLLTFADQPVFADTDGKNRNWMLSAIDAYAPEGGTALYDALWDALTHLKSVEQGRHAIVILTDGRDENNPGTAPGSAHTFDEVINLEKQVGATIYPIGLGTKVDGKILSALATQSGGEAYFPTDASALGAQFRLIVENLRRRYVLSYTSTNNKHDGGWRTVQIHTRVPGLTVKTRGGYFAPAQ